MGWDALLFANLRFKPGGLAEWKTLSFDEDSYADWGELTGHGADAESSTVGAMLEQLEDYERLAVRTGGPDLMKLSYSPLTFALRSW
ncbi:MAG: hypothetical protein HY901_06110, partial [Deltaproteobacteria bacterium]|nr:hypothetical protein [Deltaproteobacteria bacterium]